MNQRSSSGKGMTMPDIVSTSAATDEVTAAAATRTVLGLAARAGASPVEAADVLASLGLPVTAPPGVSAPTEL